VSTQVEGRGATNFPFLWVITLVESDCNGFVAGVSSTGDSMFVGAMKESLYPPNHMWNGIQTVI